MQKIGVSISVPMLQGFMTIVSALWGIVVFREMHDVLPDRRKKGVDNIHGGDDYNDCWCLGDKSGLLIGYGDISYLSILRNSQSEFLKSYGIFSENS
ncbi:MAG: hypothetical protein L6265_00240, partial [Thermoplasmatales archaeon]|nr:hypothetical protein [Thermoplasmatales archaeon]